MTSNQRRPGFRLPWATEGEAETADATATADAAASADSGETDATAEPVSATEADQQPTAADTATDAPAAPADEPSGVSTTRRTATAERAPRPAQPESSAGFMRDLVAAMRRVAEETRQSGLSDLRTKAEEQVRTLEADAERRRQELTARAETDVAGVGDWAKAETERIKQEAEQRVVARRAQLDQQLAAETTRAEVEAKALRDRVAEYERELDAYHAQLSDIADPAAFAAAAKRMPAPPRLAGVPDATAPAEPAAAAATESPEQAPEIHPAEEEVLAARLAELDATLDPVAAEGSEATPAAPAASASSAEPTSTEILVKGLGSFGAITGFRQALAAVDGIEGVSLSLGPTGEFVFRAIHPQGFDVSAAIAKLEGDGAKIETHEDGSLRVTLDRAR
ncbi:MAG TPA: hypothetical protein VF364_11355 [Candidatus Limnocylindria bacterium]